MSYRKNGLLGKGIIIKRFEYSTLGSELRKQTDITKKNVKNKTSIMNLKKGRRGKYYR